MIDAIVRNTNNKIKLRGNVILPPTFQFIIQKI